MIAEVEELRERLFWVLDARDRADWTGDREDGDRLHAEAVEIERRMAELRAGHE